MERKFAIKYGDKRSYLVEKLNFQFVQDMLFLRIVNRSSQSCQIACI